jgi:hypothetical protein
MNKMIVFLGFSFRYASEMSRSNVCVTCTECVTELMMVMKCMSRLFYGQQCSTNFD